MTVPKHNKSIARASLDLLKKTKAIRKSKPHWAVGFATAVVEGGKHSMVAAIKLPKARGDITKYGITKTMAEGLKDQTSGYGWFDGKALFLSMEKGGFARARDAMRGYFKEMGVPIPPIREGERLEASAVARIDAEDETAISELAATAVDDDPDTEETVAPDGASDVGDGAAGDAEAAPEAATDDEPVTPTEDATDDATAADPQRVVPVLDDTERQQARGQVKKVATVVRSSLTRALGDNLPDPQGLADNLGARLESHLAQLEPQMREKLMETAPGRLLMDASRKALMELQGRDDIPDVLDNYAADFAIKATEVANHFVDLGTGVLRKAQKAVNVSRKMIEQRVEGMFDDNAAPGDKLNALERLTKALLPLLADADRLEKQFGVTPPEGIKDIAPISLGIADISNARMQAVSQIEFCRAVFGVGLALEGEQMTEDDHQFFSELTDDLVERSKEFIETASNLGKRMSGGAAVPEPDILDVRQRAVRLRTEVSGLVGRIDKNDVSPTSVAKLYGEAVSSFLQRVPPP